VDKTCRLEWNQNADAPVRAVGGLLTITDGSSRIERDLDPSELRNGKFVYTPVDGRRSCAPPASNREFGAAG